MFCKKLVKTGEPPISVYPSNRRVKLSRSPWPNQDTNRPSNPIVGNPSRHEPCLCRTAASHHLRSVKTPLPLCPGPMPAPNVAASKGPSSAGYPKMVNPSQCRRVGHLDSAFASVCFPAFGRRGCRQSPAIRRPWLQGLDSWAASSSDRRWLDEAEI